MKISYWKQIKGKLLGTIACLVFIALASCSAEPEEEIIEKISYIDNYEELTNKADALRRLGAFDFESEGLVYGTDSIEVGKVAGRLYIPEDDNSTEDETPQITYILSGGQGSQDNGRFEINGSDLEITDDPLEYGDYAIRIKAVDAYNNSVEKKFNFKVTNSPPAMKNAPAFYPNFIGSTTSSQGNKLTVEWNLQRSATSYDVWISKTANSANAVLQGTYNDPATSATFDTYPGEDEAGKLPNSTRYWVWVKSKNSKGTSEFSPAAMVKTFDPIDSWWYDGVSAFQWDTVFSEGYQMTESTIRYVFNSAGLGFTGDILHHELFDPADVTKFFSPTGKFGEDLKGKPAGVFIIKMQEGSYSNNGYYYTAVYYWGKGATGRLTIGGTDEISYIINPWDGPPEQETYAKALQAFTAEKFKSKWIKLVPEPYYRVMQ
jgi:hypothetical protein